MKMRIFLASILAAFAIGASAQINLSTVDNKTFGLTNPQNVSTAHWFIGAVAQPDGLTFTHTFGVAGDYVVRATPESGFSCSGTQQSVNVHVVADITTLDIQVGWTSIGDACLGSDAATVVSIQNINNASHPFVVGDVLRVYYTVGGGAEQSTIATVAAGTGTASASFVIATGSLTAGLKSVVMTRFIYNGAQTSYASIPGSKTTSFTVNPIPTIDGIE